MAEDCKSWDEVVACAQAIYDWSKENESRDETDEQITIKVPDFDDEESDEEEDEYESMGGDESDDEPEDENEDANEEEGEVEDGEEESAEVEEIKTTGDKGGKFTGHYDDLTGARESITEHNAHNNEDMYVDENACVKTTIDLKKKFKETDIDAVLYPYKKVLSDWREFYSKEEEYETRQNTKELSKQLGETYRKHLQSKNKKIVAHMAKEFEMRQNAHRSAKAFTGTSGDLDMNRLAKYQIVDDIFKRVTYLPDGKNHGVNVMVDWSGSINGEVKDILEQSIILAEFCTKVQIPFRVYLFSDSIVKSDDDEYYSRGEEKLVEVLSNEMKSREYIEMLNYLSTIMVGRWHSELRYAWDGSAKQRKIADEYNKCMGDINHFDCDDSNNYWNWKFDDNLEPYNYRLGGTPLDHTLVAMRKFLPEFNKKYNIEKSILTVITDGFSHSSDLLRQDDAERKDVKDQIGDEWRYNSQRYILDPYSNKTFIYEDKSGDNYYSRNDFDNTQNILEWLSATCNVTITGYFIFSTKRDWMNVADVLTKGTGMYYDEQSKMWNDMKKTGSVIKVKGYNKLFLTAASNLATTGDDELDDEFVGANKNRITAAFKRNQRGKTTSRFLTNEFIKEIA